MVDTIFQQFNRVESQRRGIDPAVSEAAWNTEGGLTEPARVGKFPTGWSFWAPQLHYGGADYGQYGTVAGMGNSFTAKTGWAPGDPAAWRDALRYALDRVKAGGWGPWYGPVTIGIVGMRGIDPNFHWPGTPAGEWDYLKEKPVPELPFNPDAPIDVQPDNYSCSLQATQWLLRSIGRNPDASDPQGDPWMRSGLVPGIISPDVGLRNGTGADLAAWLNREYGSEMQFTAQYSPVTFDDVAAGAGVNPTIVGGHNYGPGGHWVGIRRVLPDGSLELANPAPNYQNSGPSIDRAEWERFGPWDAIWIDRLSTLPAPNPEPAPQPFDRAALAQELRVLMANDERRHAERRAELEALIRKVEAA